MFRIIGERIGLGIASVLTVVGSVLPAMVRILEDPEMQRAIEARDVVTGVVIGASVIGSYQAGRRSERDQTRVTAETPTPAP